MPDIFDEIDAPARTDIFDEIQPNKPANIPGGPAKNSRDIFDEIAPDAAGAPAPEASVEAPLTGYRADGTSLLAGRPPITDPTQLAQLRNFHASRDNAMFATPENAGFSGLNAAAQLAQNPPMDSPSTMGARSFMGMPEFMPVKPPGGDTQKALAAGAGLLHFGTGAAGAEVTAAGATTLASVLGVTAPELLAGIGLVSGTAGFFGFHEVSKHALAEMAKEDDLLAGPLQRAAEQQPAEEAAGEMGGLLAGVPGSVAKLAEAAKMVGDAKGTAAATQFVARQLATGAAVGVGTDALLRGAGQAAGIPGNDFSPESSGFALAVGSLLGGHSVKFRDYGTPEVADILKRGMADEAAIQAVPDGGIAPKPTLKPEEQQVYNAVRSQLAAIVATKPEGAAFDPVLAEFTARQVGGAGQGATAAESAVPVSFTDLLEGAVQPPAPPETSSAPESALAIAGGGMPEVTGRPTSVSLGMPLTSAIPTSQGVPAPIGSPAEPPTPGQLDNGTVNAPANDSIAGTLGAPGGAPAPLDMALEGSGNVSIPQVLSSFANTVQSIGGNAPLRFGRFFQRALGIYKVQPQVARIANAGDLATAAHEMAHALQHEAMGSPDSAALAAALPPPVAAELEKLGRALYGSKMPAGGYVSEGFAELVRHYLTGDDAPKLAPAALNWLTNDFLAKQPKVLGSAIGRAKALADLYRAQGAFSRAKAQMPKPPGRLEQMRDKLRGYFTAENWIEAFAPLKQLSDEYRRETGKALSPASDPYELASMRRGTSGAVTLQMVLHGMIDLNGNLATDASGRPIGSLREILAPLRGLEHETWAYMWARRALELHDRRIDPGMSRPDAEHLVRTLGNEYPELAPAAERVYAWQNAVLDYLKQANPALSDSIERMREVNQNYVPLGRVMGAPGTRNVVTRMAANPLKFIHGSGRQVKAMGDQIISNTQKLVAMAHKAQVLQTVVNLSRTPGLGHIIEEVPQDRVRKTISLEQIRPQLEAMGLDTSSLGPDEMLDFYTTADTPKGDDPIVPVRLGGVVRWFQVSPELYELLSSMEPRELKGVAWLLGVLPARTFRLGATGLRGSFNYITNPVRDLQTLWMQTQASDNPFEVAAAYFSALREVIVSGIGDIFGTKTTPFSAMFNQLGIVSGQPLGVGINHTRVAAKGLFQSQLRQVATSPMGYFRGLLNFMEKVPRIAEMMLVAKRIGYVPGTPMTADQATALALAGRRVTTDFAAGGKLALLFNRAIPFFNANIQGSRNAVRITRNRPWAIAIKMLGLAGLGLAAWWSNRTRREYINLPAREKFMYWNFFTPDGNVIQIPKTQEWGLVPTMAEALAAGMERKDPRAMEQAGKFAFDTLSPLALPPLMNTAKEQLQNRIDYFNKPIVPRSQIDLPPGEQANLYTHQLSKALGRAFPNSISPERIDAAVRSTLAGAGDDALSASDRLVQALGLTPAPDRRDTEKSDWFILGRIFRRNGMTSAQSQPLADFWDMYSALEERSKSKQWPLSSTEQLYFLRLSSRGSTKGENPRPAGEKETIKMLAAAADAKPDMKSRQVLFQQMTDIAERALADRPK